MKDAEEMQEVVNGGDLQEAAGGIGDEIITIMKCDVCEFETEWAGDYMNGQMYVCPQTTLVWPVSERCPAKEPSLHGVRYRD